MKFGMISQGTPSTGGIPQYWGNGIFGYWGNSPALGKCCFFNINFKYEGIELMCYNKSGVCRNDVGI